MKISVLVVNFLILAMVNTVHADDVRIIAAGMHSLGGDRWSVSVTLQHGDTGWDHYADNWRIVDAQGNLLGDRVLYHPHVGEQPFTRGLGGVTVPKGVTIVYIEAHDKVHGWTSNRLQVDLGKATGGRLRVEAE